MRFFLIPYNVAFFQIWYAYFLFIFNVPQSQETLRSGGAAFSWLEN